MAWGFGTVAAQVLFQSWLWNWNQDPVGLVKGTWLQMTGRAWASSVWAVGAASLPLHPQRERAAAGCSQLGDGGPRPEAGACCCLGRACASWWGEASVCASFCSGCSEEAVGPWPEEDLAVGGKEVPCRGPF